MTVRRANGVTEAERYLSHLCDRTFLSLWSYPGIYRNQISGRSTEGKEVCDLLVVFENHIIVFSDKDCRFPSSDNLNLDWNRWFRRAIYKSAEQAWGAERWIKQHSNRLFLDRTCSTPFPIEIPDISTAKFHLIVVAHDSSMRCQQELGGSGSLMINSSIRGVSHHIDNNRGMPFFIGDIDPDRTFVHVLDNTSLDIVLGTLDTISDFVSYLTKKERLLRSDAIIWATGEEDLLAYYLTNINDRDEHDFVVPCNEETHTAHLLFDEGYWEEFSQSDERQAQVLANQISYIWDDLIERFISDIVQGTQYFATHPGIQGSEQLLRFLARETRFRRRILSSALCGFIESAPNDMRATRYIPPFSTKDPCYVFLTLPQFDSMSYERYREIRRYLLNACCSSAKLRFPDIQHIIGIATEPGINNGGRSEDVIYVDVTSWTEEDNSRSRQVARELDILVNPQVLNVNFQEYPMHDTIA